MSPPVAMTSRPPKAMIGEEGEGDRHERDMREIEMRKVSVELP